MLGKRVYAIWGAMFPWSHGSIVAVDGMKVYVAWDEDDPNFENGMDDAWVEYSASSIKPAGYEPGPGESPIGVYFEEE
jgi:hypothetical protein